MKKRAVYAVLVVIIFVIGFEAGREYTKYQMRKALNEFQTNMSTVFQTPALKPTESKKTEFNIIQKNIGDEVALATLKYTVNSVSEKQTLSKKYSEPVTAQENTIFVIVNLSVTNILDSGFDLNSNLFYIVDNKQREYTVHSDATFALDEYLAGRELAPSIPEKGSIAFLIPTDSTSYSLCTQKKNTNDLYCTVLK